MSLAAQEQVRFPGLEHQLALAYSYLRVLRKLIQDAEIVDFPSESPLALLYLLNNVTDKLEYRLNSYKAELSPTLSSESMLLLYLAIQTVARAAALYLPPLIRYIEAANVHLVPWGMAGQLRRLCRSFNPSLHLIVRPRFRFSYEHVEVRALVRAAVMGDPEIVPFLDAQPLFLVLSFPRTQRNNILQQAVWGHEIAHALERQLAQDFELVPSNIAYTRSPAELTLAGYLVRQLGIEIKDEDVEALLTQIQRNYERNFDRTAIDRPKVQVHVTEILHSWLTEITCDLLAIRLFGPAALFAFSEVVETLHNLVRLTDSHPAPILRMRIMIDEIQELGLIDLADQEDLPKKWGGYGSVLGEEITRLQALCGMALHDVQDEQQYLGEIRHHIVLKKLGRNILENIRAFIRKIEGQYFLDISKLQFHTPVLVQYLEAKIPPNQVIADDSCEPASLPEILNAGWIYWLKVRQAAEESSASLLDERDIVNKLVLKAIESSEIQLQYAERRRMASDEE